MSGVRSDRCSGLGLVGCFRERPIHRRAGFVDHPNAGGGVAVSGWSPSIPKDGSVLSTVTSSPSPAAARRSGSALVCAAVVLLAAACDEPRSSNDRPQAIPASSPATLPARPLGLPSVPPGGACPLAQASPWPDSSEATRVLGTGPAHPVADYFHDGAVLRLRDDDREPDGNYVKKVRWVVADYTGPLLVRAGRIDGPGSASVKFSYTGKVRDGGYYTELTNRRSDLPATTTVSGPGCYAYQVEGTTFSTTVVFSAVLDKPQSSIRGAVWCVDVGRSRHGPFHCGTARTF